MGCGWLWDLSADDDSEEHWAPAAGSGAATAEVRGAPWVPPASQEKWWQWKPCSRGNQKVHHTRNALMMGLNGQVNLGPTDNIEGTGLLIQASSDYQEVQAEPLPQGRGDVQQAQVGHAPPGPGQTLSRGCRAHTQGTRGQGRCHICHICHIVTSTSDLNMIVFHLFLSVGPVTAKHSKL